MLPANLISALQALSNSGKPLISAAAATAHPVTKLEPGAQLQGNVQSRISEGLFNVQVAGQTLQMRLPANIRSGDVIKLEVISTQPRITFRMVASANPLSTPEQIGATARMLANLAEQPLERQAVHQVGNKPVWQAEPEVQDTRQLAGALRDTLAKSGLFYESHQAQWVRGERSISQLLEEPQNLLGSNSNLSLSANRQANQGAKLPAGFAGGAVAATGGGTPETTSYNMASSTKTEQMARAASEISQPVTEELLHLVRQQLHTLEHHHLVWLGQVWTGQQMQWEIRGEPEHHGQQPDERQWSTEMELSLPKLGDVHARMVFTESGLRLQLRATDAKTVEIFNRALPRLNNSLARADIELLAAMVDKA